MTDVIVWTSGGPVRGVDRGGSVAFYGIPYAAPPTGSRAFALPQPAGSWEAVRDATTPGATAQRTGFDGGTIPEPSVPGSDILTVNVFTPSDRPGAVPDPAPDAGLPVLVYIHGGAYIAGSPVSPWYDGAAFNRDRVVVVTLGYRLGVYGFGVLPDAPSNRAVHDWLAGLAWVRRNIAAFGGDPGRVTVAGQSAGGGAVLTLLGVPGIEGFVQRAIAVSPVLSQVTPDEGRRTVAEAAALVGVPPTSDALAALPREKIDDVPWHLANTFGAAPARASTQTDPVELLRETLRSLEFCPVLDGDLLTTSIADGARRSRIPLIIGAAAHEMTDAIGPVFGPRDQAALERMGLGAEEARRYLKLRGSGDEDWGQLLSDLMFRVAVPAVAEGREDTWVYDFRHLAGGEIDPGHAFHCTDLPFAWDCLGAEGVSRAVGSAPQGLADEIHGSWVSFVVSGDPGWAPYSITRTVRRFGSPGPTTTLDGYGAERVLVGLL